MITACIHNDLVSFRLYDATPPVTTEIMIRNRDICDEMIVSV